jgi:formyl-CoA transferase
MGEPGWALDPRLDTAAGRQEHAADLDRRLGEWTREQEPYALALRLQGSGVPAGVVQRCSDLHRDPQLAARGALAWVEHPEMGRTPYETWAFACSETPSRLDPAPCLGADTTAVLREVLALTDPEIAALEAEGVLR